MASFVVVAPARRVASPAAVVAWAAVVAGGLALAWWLAQFWVGCGVGAPDRLLTVAAGAALRLFHIPVERTGFVLVLPSGGLDVVEACSGVRSGAAITAVAALLAYLRGFGFGRGAAFVLLSLPVMVAANTGRLVL